MKTKQLIMAFVACTFVATSFAAEMPTDPLGGKPPAGSKVSVKDLDYQVKYQRAFEAVLWSMPAVGMYAYWHAAEDWGAGSNAIIAWSKPATPYLEGVTGNNQTPYLLSQTDLSKGPVVLEVPAATDKATLYGQVVDHWQISIADLYDGRGELWRVKEAHNNIHYQVGVPWYALETSHDLISGRHLPIGLGNELKGYQYHWDFKVKERDYTPAALRRSGPTPQRARTGRGSRN